MRQPHIIEDISHFRAPYKNLPGFGAYAFQRPNAWSPWQRISVGAVDTTIPVPPSGEKLTVKGGDGIVRYKPDVANAIKVALAGFSAAFTSLTGPWQGDPAVILTAFTPAEIEIAKKDPAASKMLYDRSALAWLQQRVAEKRFVLAPLGIFSVPGQNMLWATSDAKKITAMSDAEKELVPVLAGPEGIGEQLKRAAMSPVVIGLAAAAVAAGVLLYAKKRKKRTATGYAPNAKTYIVYVDGVETKLITAASHNAAEKKAQRMYPGRNVSVAYTEV